MDVERQRVQWRERSRRYREHRRAARVSSCMLDDMRQRSLKRGVPPPQELPDGLTFEWLVKRLERGRCQVTGLPLNLKRKAGPGKSRRWSATVDRVDSDNPLYTKQNCRVVIMEFNRLREHYGDDLAISVCELQADGASTFEIRQFLDDCFEEL